MLFGSLVGTAMHKQSTVSEHSNNQQHPHPPRRPGVHTTVNPVSTLHHDVKQLTTLQGKTAIQPILRWHHRHHPARAEFFSSCLRMLSQKRNCSQQSTITMDLSSHMHPDNTCAVAIRFGFPLEWETLFHGLKFWNTVETWTKQRERQQLATNKLFFQSQ